MKLHTYVAGSVKYSEFELVSAFDRLTGGIVGELPIQTDTQLALTLSFFEQLVAWSSYNSREYHVMYTNHYMYDSVTGVLELSNIDTKLNSVQFITSSPR